MDKILNSPAVKKQLKLRKIPDSSILDQVSQFERGNISVELIRPAVVGDGIKSLDKGGEEELVDIYESAVGELVCVKFVPASGAASRMFKDLLAEYSEMLRLKDQDPEQLQSTNKLLDNISKFAFHDELKAVSESDELPEIIEKLLLPTGLNYSNIAKGLIKFHKKDNRAVTAFEEHLEESKSYIRGNDGRCRIHFTVPDDQINDIKKYLQSVKDYYEDQNTSYDLTYSVQDPSTDTIGVDMQDKPFLGDGGELLFRPAGHGALINNLNSIEADIVFIKNIDNVTVPKYLGETIRFKKMLGGYLLLIKNRIHEFLNLLEGGKPDREKIEEIISFAEEHLFMDLDEGSLKEQLNRPIRVCGVVKNEGEPGGGPFWIKSNDNTESLQIVESAQVNTESEAQTEIWNSSTHFNPVDLVCWVNDFRGNKFDLNKYVDHNAGIITVKSIDGEEIKALELPGLWNGAMADWITVFIEVPQVTFNPVKTVFDLLRKEHQN